MASSAAVEGEKKEEVEEEEEAAGEFDDPFAMMGGMGEEEVYKVTLMEEAKEGEATGNDSGGQPPPADLPRSRVMDKRCSGLVLEWKGRFGWIQPLKKVQHEQASKHRGRIYLSEKDCAEENGVKSVVKEGKIVDFFVYLDGDGLGAEECQPRSVLRLMLSHNEANKTFKDVTPQWSEYLPESEYYPVFEEEHGVLLRKYAWPLPFALVELWGHEEELVAAALHLATRGEGQEEDCSLRLLLPEDFIEKVGSIPTEPKLSENAVVSRPLPCRSLTLQASKERCAEAIKEFLQVVKSPAPPAVEAA